MTALTRPGAGAAVSFGAVVAGEAVGPVPGPVETIDVRHGRFRVEVPEAARAAVEPDRPGPGGEVPDDVPERAVPVSGGENDVGVEGCGTRCREVDDP